MNILKTFLAKIFFIIICMYLVACEFCSNSAVKNSKIYSYINQMETDNFMEKNNNPGCCYQVSGDYKFIQYRNKLYKIGEQENIKEIASNVQNFLVVGNTVYYCTFMDLYGNELRACDLEGNSDRKLYTDIDSVTLIQNGKALLMTGHIRDWSLALFDLETEKVRVIDSTYSASTKYSCFNEDCFLGTGDYTIDSVNKNTGEVNELLEFYDDGSAFAKVTCLYMHDGELYYGLLAMDEKKDTFTGLWKYNFDSSKSEKIQNGKVNSISFIGDELIVNI